MNSQYKNNTRFPVWCIPILCGILASFCVGSVNATPSRTLSKNTLRISSPDLDGHSDQQLVTGEILVGENLLLKLLINFLAGLLDEPANAQNTAPVDVTLLASANSLISGYPFIGLDPNLASPQIADGVDNARSLVDLINNSSNTLRLDAVTQAELKATAEAMIEDLQNGI